MSDGDHAATSEPTTQDREGPSNDVDATHDVEANDVDNGEGASPDRRVRRRDFLAGAGIGALLVGMPWLARAAVGPSRTPLAPPDAPIARVAVYPAIGVSRVGGSPSWFLAPEVPGLPPDPEGGFKDGLQAIKKQVQRFRVYAFAADGAVIGELTDAEADIEWTVHVANTKAAWYGFANPLDNGELAPGLPGKRRNAFVVDEQDRERMLCIDGAPTSISGRSTNAEGRAGQYAMGGTFFDTEEVGLGHLQTDEAGRLLVVPPDGVSMSPTGAPITNFADNDAWHDDWCDGPVQATVTLPDGRTLTAEHAWVACVGPDFAPEIPAITTLYDVIEDLNTAQGWRPAPTLPLSFRAHIYPTLRRLALMQWVSGAAHLRQGWIDVGDFSDPAYLAQLADPSPANAGLRRSVFEAFRNPHNTGPEAFREEALKLPYMLGDGINYDGSPLQWFQFPDLQYAWLQHWADGDFVDDLEDPADGPITVLEDIDVAEQPAALTRAALDACSGGAFHPGVELTYNLRNPALYARDTDAQAEPFRIALGDRPSLLQDLGRLLTPELAMDGNETTPAPLGPQMPGDLTRWMGLPWQCDAFSCQQVNLQEDFPTPVWWPALLPIDVLPEAHYEQVLRSDLDASQRIRFFESRVAWSRGVAGIGYHAEASYMDGITNMIELWERMGFVVRRPGPADPARPEHLPEELFVEVDRDDVELRFDWSPEDGQLPN